MNFTEFIYALGYTLTASFKVLPLIGNNFNYATIVVGLVGLVYWLLFQKRKTKEAKENGTYI